MKTLEERIQDDLEAKESIEKEGVKAEQEEQKKKEQSVVDEGVNVLRRLVQPEDCPMEEYYDWDPDQAKYISDDMIRVEAENWVFTVVRTEVESRQEAPDTWEVQANVLDGESKEAIAIRRLADLVGLTPDPDAY